MFGVLVGCMLQSTAVIDDALNSLRGSAKQTLMDRRARSHSSRQENIVQNPSCMAFFSDKMYSAI